MGPKINEILTHAVRNNASDIHLYSNTRPAWRIDGNILDIEKFKEIPEPELEEMLYEILPEKNREEFEETFDTDFGYDIAKIGRFRVNYLYDRNGIAAVFRLIPLKIFTMEDLAIPEKIKELCFLPKGLIIVTGPTGCGKSTTLAAIIDFINKNRKDHIVTIEDPIEFIHQSNKCRINQREIGVHTSSFQRALRAALREDPDIILIGEMRDLETIEIALETAETGHLVFGTLHTNTAVSTIDRIIDQFHSEKQNQIRLMLSDTLKAVIAQTLVRKKDSGRVAAFEILLNTQAVANLIRERKNSQIYSIMQTTKQKGMKTLNDSLFELLRRGVISSKEAYIKSIDKDGLLQTFEKNNIKFRPSQVFEYDFDII